MSKNMQMKKETGKILHRKFMSENIGLLLIAPVFLLLMFTVSNLYQLPAEYVFYLTSIFLILWVTALCMQYRGFWKRTEQYEKESKEMQESNSEESRQWEELQEKQDFFALWAHQIKTPIAALRLLLEEEEPDRAAMEGEIYRIEQYVEFALQYQRLEGGHKDLVFAHYSLESIVKKALKKTGVLFRRTKLALELGNLQTDVLTDEKWLVFVLEQVLTNAVKYTRKGKISIYLDPKKEKTLVVEDTGMGIRPEDLPRIFEWGYTGYNGRIKNRATGIGLALCRQTMEMLGHRISAKSEPGKGTCIYLDLAVDPVRDY